ncbi:hypothetical protein GCM10007424_19850 [Flavobacterium suaedae]|uniref:Lipoprotein n=1 Tax=Flavobacterium suaedae TaxID=1767027 RepID=A0ABQ1JVV0_9FLAO|nr:hypothetical protein [Flavobacterium suaedae]GGB79704.1 hypothetical protein GCM10007424_19850 [Flavobacterium suaedae]
MKKIFLLLTVTVLSLTTTSCSSDDSSETTTSGSYIKYKVDGVQKTLNNISVEINSDFGYNYLEIIGQNGNDITEKLGFALDIDEENNNSIETVEENYLQIYYEYAGLYYEHGGAASTYDYETEIFTDERIKGNFTGILEASTNGSESQYKTFTEGSFDIYIEDLLQQ